MIHNIDIAALAVQRRALAVQDHPAIDDLARWIDAVLDASDAGEREITVRLYGVRS